MGSAARWEQRIQVPNDFVSRLNTFITRPDTRRQDVFWEETVPVDPPLTMHLVIKHDLYEGVVLHLSLYDMDAYRFLAGHEVSLREAVEALGAFDVVWQNTTYRIYLHT